MADDRELKRTANLDAVGWPDDEYSEDLGHGRERIDAGDTTDATRPLGHHEAPAARERVGDGADRVTVLRAGTRLQQGSTYVDLERLEEGPFIGLAGQEVGAGQLIVSKKDLDPETWNRLVGQGAQRRTERPDESR